MENEGIVSNRLRGKCFSAQLILKIYHNIYDCIIVNYQYDGTVERPTSIFVGRIFQQGVDPTGLSCYFWSRLCGKGQTSLPKQIIVGKICTHMPYQLLWISLHQSSIKGMQF